MNIQHIEFGLPGIFSPRDGIKFLKAELRDAVSSVPSIQLELTVDSLSHEGLKLDQWIGQQALIRFFTPAKSENPQNRLPSFFKAGLVKQLRAQLDNHSKVVGLKLELQIWPNAAGTKIFTKAYRFFQNQTSLEITDMIFKAAGGLVNEIISQNLNLKKRDYEVQYAESDIEFVRRILAEDGLLFCLNFNNSFKLALGSEFPNTPLVPNIQIFKDLFDLPFINKELINTPNQTNSMGMRHGVYDLEEASVHSFDTVSLSASSTSIDLRVTQQSETIFSQKLSRAEWIEVDAHQYFNNIDDGYAQAAHRIYSTQTPEYFFGFDEDELAIGQRYALKIDADQPTTSVALISLTQVVDSDGKSSHVISGKVRAKKASASFDNHWVKPIPRPVLPGLLRAVVLDSQQNPKYTQRATDSAPYIDAYGRIKVRILWHNEARKEEASPADSPYIRLVTPWAGQSAGFLALPRPGQEVIVSFINGDASQPIVLGAVYGQPEEDAHHHPWVPNESNWVGVSTHDKNADAKGQYLRLDSNRLNNKGVEFISSDQMTLEAQTELVLQSMKDKISLLAETDLSLSAKNSIYINGEILQVNTATTQSKATVGGWDYKGDYKSTYQSNVTVGGVSTETIGIKNSNVGLTSNLIGISNTNAALVTNFGAFKYEFLVIKSETLVYSDKKTIIKKEDSISKNQNSVIKTDNSAIKSNQSGAALTNGGVNIETNGFKCLV